MMINIEEHLGLAYALSNKLSFKHRDLEKEYIEQLCLLGLTKAAHRFDVSKGVEFSTYAYITMEGEVLNHIRDKGWFKGDVKNRPYAPGMSLDAEVKSYDNKSTYIIDLIPNIDKNFEYVELNTLVKEMLTVEEREVIVDIFYKDKSQGEIADKLGISQARVSRIKAKALKKLRQALEIDKKRVA